LVIGFIGLFVTARDYILQITVRHTHTHTHTHTQAQTHTHTRAHTSVHSHVFISRCLVTVSKGGRSPSSGFRNYPRPWLSVSNSNSSKRLNISTSLNNSVTNQPTQLTLIVISARTAQTNRSLLLCNCYSGNMFAKPLLRTAAIQLLLSLSLPSNRSTCHNTLSGAGIAIGYGLEDSGFYSRQAQAILFYSTASRPALGSIHSPVPWEKGAVSPE
jgi:hypothetical protein